MTEQEFPRRKVVKVNAMAYAAMIKLLLEGVYSCQEIAEHTGLHYVTVLDYTRELHRVGAIHISSYEKDSRGRDLVKIYKVGAGKDAKREKMTGAERQARVRQKKKQLRMAHMFAGSSILIGPSPSTTATASG